MRRLNRQEHEFRLAMWSMAVGLAILTGIAIAAWV